MCPFKPRPQSKYKSTKVSDDTTSFLAQFDITEPPIKGSMGYRYIATVYDRSTGFIDAEACTTRTEAVLHLCNYLERNNYITCVRMDGAPELNSAEVKDL